MACGLIFLTSFISDCLNLDFNLGFYSYMLACRPVSGVQRLLQREKRGPCKKRKMNKWRGRGKKIPVKTCSVLESCFLTHKNKDRKQRGNKLYETLHA